MASLISATAWVPRGVAAQHPQQYKLDAEELQRVSAIAKEELQDAELQLEKVRKLAGSMGKEGRSEVEHENDDGEWEDTSSDSDADDAPEDNQMDIDVKPKDPNDLSEYNLEDYDDPTAVEPGGGLFSNIKGLTFYRDNEDDPYITLKEDDEAQEKEELEVLPSDNLIVVAKTEDEVSQLEIYLYDELQDNLYVHHDLMLPSFPLCLEWLDFPPSSSGSDAASSSSGNFIAVGTFEPEIEIWSLDVIDGLYPDGVLGRPDKSKQHVPVPLGTGKKKKKKTKAREDNAEYHVDAVLGLSWNRSHRNLLASASADKTVKLWDLSRESTSPAVRSFSVHKDKVQAIRWNQAEPTVLLTGSYDRTIRMFDTRSPDAGVGAIVGSDVEVLRWDPWQPQTFYASLENGTVLSFDSRTLGSDLNLSKPPNFTLSAHDGAVSGLDINPNIKGCIATGGTDKVVKIWNLEEVGSRMEVSMVTSRDLGVGKVFSLNWSPDDPLTLAAAGSKTSLQLWDVGSNASVRSTFKTKLAQAGKQLKEKATSTGGVIGLAQDDEDASDAD